MIAKFQFKVTVHYGLRAKCAQLRPIDLFFEGLLFTNYKWIIVRVINLTLL